MSGQNKNLKEGAVLFKAGDKSDGMYIVRRGEVRVYLEQNGKEVALATVGSGGMIGEMALFDNLPRSANVKAVGACEVTHITNDDFGKLMKQIPKWFVGLMSALSSRLRTTNERLQKIESGAKTKPFQLFIRTLHVISLLLHKDGQKDGKEVTIARPEVDKMMVEGFGEDPEAIKQILNALVQEKVVNVRLDSYKNQVLVLPTKGTLSQLAAFTISFVRALAKAGCKTPAFNESTLNLLKVLARLTEASPYDAITCSLKDMKKEAQRDGLDTKQWDEDAKLFASGFDEVKYVKVSDGFGLKANKKDVGAFLRNCEILAAMHKANLS